MNSTATLPPPTATRHQTYTKLACGIGANNNYVQVLGLTSGKTPGQPAVASMQKSPSAQGDWQPSLIPLTGATAPAVLADLVVCPGMDNTHAVGLGNDGNLYVAGTQNPLGQWAAGSGLIPANATFSPGTLTAQLINSVTLFALSPTKKAWVAAYHNQGKPGWQPGYALPDSTAYNYQWLAARPEVSDQGTIHAIGLTSGGNACEVATARGPGTGVGNWQAGHGRLGNPAGLPTFTQLLLVSGDTSSTFHVIGLGADGSVWDIDQFAATAPKPVWSGVSTQIAGPGTVTDSRIDFFVTASSGIIAIKLVTRSGMALKVFASFITTWTSSNDSIPTSGVSSGWQIVSNLASGSDLFVLGLSGVGLAYELAYCSNGSWTAGSQKPISG